MKTLSTFFTDPGTWFALFLLLSALAIWLFASRFRAHLQKALNWTAENYVWIILPLGLVGITLVIYFWVWDIRS